MRWTKPVLLVALLLPLPAVAQDRIIGRDGRTQGYLDRLPGSTDQYRITGRDGRATGYVDGSSGRIIGRDGRTQGYVSPAPLGAPERRRER